MSFTNYYCSSSWYFGYIQLHTKKYMYNTLISYMLPVYLKSFSYNVISDLFMVNKLNCFRFLKLLTHVFTYQILSMCIADCRTDLNNYFKVRQLKINETVLLQVYSFIHPPDKVTINLPLMIYEMLIFSYCIHISASFSFNCK